MSEDITTSSGNVFADLGLPDPNGLLAKARLLSQINAAIEQRGLDLLQTAEVLSMPVPELERLLAGSTQKYPISKLLSYLNLLIAELEDDEVEGTDW